ncbi:MAG: glycoside hydrolase family 73 protein [Candidatus Korobacteraceae bacterium]
MTRTEFLDTATHAALAASRSSRLPAGVTVAQAALESAWGRSRLSREAHNYFGIKAHGSHPWIELPTTEVEKGTAVRVRARFALYRSMEECFTDRDLLILKSPRYRAARAAAANPEEFICSLALHWATDPQYADKLLRVYRSNKLSDLDTPDYSSTAAP